MLHINNVKPVVLVAPLDWGLGHAARCIPIIHKCLNAGCEVIIAAKDPQKALLKVEFPELLTVDLPGYGLKYASKKWMTVLGIAIQAPKILITINREKGWLKKFCKSKHLDIIIADNRYGLHHPNAISVFITHQLRIKSPLGNRIDRLLQLINYRFIKHFNYCWVPDSKEQINLAGILSHPYSLPSVETRYINTLSRISKEDRPITNKLLVLLSGPEPQRSIFEKKIITALEQSSLPAIVVRGLPSPSSHRLQTSSFIEVEDHLNAAQMQQAINESEIIISRSGYSTIMDVLPLGKKCIFIPTPGQTEQEYLAKYLSEKGWCCTASQNNFLLSDLIKKAGALQMTDLSFLSNNKKLQECIEEIVTAVVAKKQSQEPSFG